MKTCPVCGVNHTKRGRFCGQSCGNSRPQSDELKAQKSAKLLAYHASPEGAATRSIASDFANRLNKNRALERSGEYVLEDPDWMLDIPLTTENMHTYHDEDDTSWL
jgi:predicted nucleic acid-binding Zn ribbon protein